ncbi:malonyl-CoA decarboxylase, mitochondrial isoform X2 [Rosa chinensis]|uniref:malonyl-CoA decarboxylase, mitochondrial isoform X2 n=1 Tax=Rosa chinensis TaxID=74649 RepID=UPI000D089E24|nr:malonyl-CoA decarboxylase, mitochondrial isoform X2 [Rosa chinensis]
MQHISTFATLSPIPGYMQWLLSKLASQSKLAKGEDMPNSLADRSGSTFWENILEPEEERALMDASMEFTTGKNNMEVMLNLLTSANHEWTKSDILLSVLKPPLMRLCARVPSAREKERQSSGFCCKFSLTEGSGFNGAEAWRR